ncbi:MAG: hypothetical protein JSR48_02130 [Verrucomicrobia bacterium]|nr:hypothetical protein [Verrucomicrobiota bacterium]
MPTLPPLLPSETLERVVGQARLNGTWVMVIGSTFGLIGAAGGEVVGCLTWLLVAGTGAMALHGGSLLHDGETRGLNWLVGGQLFCMAFLLALCGWQLTHIDLAPLQAALTPDIRESLGQTGLSEREFLLLSYRVTYALIALVAVCYPGMMALYFHRRRAAIAAALDGE